MTDATQARKPSITSLIAISGLNPMAMNIVTPSLPGLAIAFAVDYGVAQLTLTVFLASIAVAQLILGPLSDRYGRRPLVLVGIAVFVVGSIGCALAPSIVWLLCGRIVQAFGGCAGFVLARAMVRDMHGREQAASIFGSITMVMVLAPMLSPLLGGVIDTSLGWRAVHWAMALTGAALLAYAWIALHETLHVRNQHVGGLAGMAGDFATLLRYPAFQGHSLTVALTSATYFAFIAGAPYAVVSLMGRESSVYGIWFAIAASGYMAGNFVTGRYGPRFGSRRLIRWGTAGALASILLMALGIAVLPLTPVVLFLPMVPITFFNGLALPGATAAAISVRPDLAGAGAGLSGALQLGLGAFLTWVVGHSVGTTVWPMMIAMIVCSILALAGAVMAARAEDTTGG
jgi:DHA1 family bicyclomycin/chloramphenicol resistance-like MFS transporter